MIKSLIPPNEVEKENEDEQEEVVMAVLDDLPDEIILEVLKFLDPVFLLHRVQLSSVRMFKLIESEYMYERHHFKYLVHGDDIMEEKKPDQSWKDHVKLNYELQKCKWIVPRNYSESCELVEFPKDKYDKVALIHTPEDIGGGWRRATSIFCNKSINPNLHYEWEVEIISSDRNPYNYWFILDVLYDEKNGQIKNDSGIVEYLYQLDGGGFHQSGSGLINQSKGANKKYGCQPLFALLDDNNTMTVKFYVNNWVWGVKGFDSNNEYVFHAFCNLKKKKRNTEYFFGVASLTLRKSREVKLKSFKKI